MVIVHPKIVTLRLYNVGRWLENMMILLILFNIRNLDKWKNEISEWNEDEDYDYLLECDSDYPKELHNEWTWRFNIHSITSLIIQDFLHYLIQKTILFNTETWKYGNCFQIQRLYETVYQF